MAQSLRTRVLIVLAWCVIVLVTDRANAQTVFFDDFDGDALLPHWNLPFPQDWNYNVSNGMLNVTALNYPSTPKSPGNFALMRTLFTSSLTNFRVDSWMGWEEAADPHRLLLDLRTGPSASGGFATCGYRRGDGFGSGPLFFAGTAAGVVIRPAPATGMFHFAAERNGSNIDFFIDDQFYARLPEPNRFALTGLAYDFVGPYPEPMGPLHIDRLRVVPAPASVIALAIGSVVIVRRKRLYRNVE